MDSKLFLFSTQMAVFFLIWVSPMVRQTSIMLLVLFCFVYPIRSYGVSIMVNTTYFMNDISIYLMIRYFNT